MVPTRKILLHFGKRNSLVNNRLVCKVQYFYQFNFATVSFYHLYKRSVRFLEHACTKLCILTWWFQYAPPPQPFLFSADFIQSRSTIYQDSIQIMIRNFIISSCFPCGNTTLIKITVNQSDPFIHHPRFTTHRAQWITLSINEWSDGQTKHPLTIWPRDPKNVSDINAHSPLMESSAGDNSNLDFIRIVVKNNAYLKL